MKTSAKCNALISENYPLTIIAEALASEGKSLWLVGGCVRDSLIGKNPKDIDLCTDATPDEQIAIYKDYGFSVHETGLQHGTLTVVMAGEPYEITTLRTEANHDGRHADVTWTTDLEADLARRDLTINAMAVTMTGELIDPFGGASDLEDGIVRFVGNPSDRMKEDYLRILRFFRFHARFASSDHVDPFTMDAIMANVRGLETISVERIWMEMSKIISGPNAVRTMDIIQLSITNAIELPRGNLRKLENALVNGVKNPAVLMAAYLGPYVGTVAQAWKWSKADCQAAMYAIANNNVDLDQLRVLLTRSVPVSVISELAALNGIDRTKVDGWEIPVFPVSGNDLMDRMDPGPQMGQTIRRLRDMWAKSDFTMDKTALLAAI